MPIFFFLFALALILPVLWPQSDLLASGLFYHAGQGFFLADNPVFMSLHWLAYYGARGLGVGFACLLVIGIYRERNRYCPSPLPRVTTPAVAFSELGYRAPRKGEGTTALNAKAWGFLFLALLIGPVLIANVGFKDHWGRSRPREVVEFGGTAEFTPVLEPHFERAHSNGSFVAGDAAFGFFLPAIAFVVPRRASRHTFWSAMGAAGLFSAARLVMGAHFLGDIIYAAFFMLLSVTAVHAAMYGRSETIARWHGFFKRPTNV